MPKPEKLYPGQFYHIYHRGNNRENIFIEEKNYNYFLDLWKKYIMIIADTWAYCLMKNHFHALVRIHDSVETSEVYKTSEVYLYISKQFSNLFNAYSKAINKKYDRTGSLFQTRFGRKCVTSDAYLINLVHYIHFNPQKHKFVKNFRDYPHSSWHTFLSLKKTNVSRRDVLELFGGADELLDFHNRENDFKIIQSLIEDDDF